MYQIINEHNDSIAYTPSLDIAIDIAQVHVLIEPYFETLSPARLYNAALEWIFES